MSSTESLSEDCKSTERANRSLPNTRGKDARHHRNLPSRHVCSVEFKKNNLLHLYGRGRYWKKIVLHDHAIKGKGVKNKETASGPVRGVHR
jgi:hypothetical protein